MTTYRYLPHTVYRAPDNEFWQIIEYRSFHAQPFFKIEQPDWAGSGELPTEFTTLGEAKQYAEDNGWMVQDSFQGYR